MGHLEKEVLRMNLKIIGPIESSNSWPLFVLLFPLCYLPDACVVVITANRDVIECSMMAKLCRIPDDDHLAWPSKNWAMKCIVE